MQGDNTIWRTAFQIVHRYGEAAGARTAGRLIRELQVGNLGGQRTWALLLDAVIEL